MKKVIYLFLLFVFMRDLYSFEVDFSPKKRGRTPSEIRLRFSKNIAPLGDPTYKYNPIESIDCTDIKADGVWEEASLFVLKFERPLQAGLNCKVKLRDDIKSIDGESYNGERVFQFDTDVVIVNNIFPHSYQLIRNDEVFLFSFNGSVDIKKNINRIYFVRQHSAEAIESVLLSEEDKNKFIEEFYPYLKEYSSEYFAIRPKMALGDGEDISIVFNNIESKSGLVSGIAQKFTYSVKPGFEIKLTCERESANKGCIPITSIKIELSEPIETRYVEGFYLLDEKNNRIAPVKPDELNEFIHYIIFEPPFLPEHKYKLYVPDNLVDILGRKPINIKKFPLEFTTDRVPPLLKFSAAFGIIEMIDGEAILPVTVRGLDENTKIRIANYYYENNAAEGEVEVEKKSLLQRIWEFIKSLFIRKTKVVEKKAEDRKYIIPPLKVRSYNLAEIKENQLFDILNNVEYEKYDESYFQKAKIQYEENISVDIANIKESTVIGIPFKRYGLYLLEVESGAFKDYLVQQEEGKKSDKAYLHTTVLVTNMAITFKKGRDSSLVFVTRLSDGEPVEGAEVKVFDCRGEEYFTGITDENGILYIDRALPPDSVLPRCGSSESYYIGGSNYLDSGLIVTARYGSDFSFVNSNWSKGLESYRFNIYSSGYSSNYIIHSVLSRNLLRAGETLHIAGYFRKKVKNDFLFPASDELPKKIRIEHTGTEKVWEYNINWDDAASTLLKWDVPRDANTGHYRITYFDCYTDNTDRKCNYDGGDFMVEEFKVPLIKGELIVKESDSKKVTVEGVFNYLMGAPANDLQVTLRYRFSDSFYFSDDRYDNYDFSKGKVKAGIKKSISYGYEEMDNAEYDDAIGEPDRTVAILPEQIHIKTDEYGRFRAEIPIKKEWNRPLVLSIEAGYTDPNGYFNTISTSKTIYNSPFIIGLNSTTDFKDKAINAKVVLLNTDKKPVKGESVVVNMYQKIYYTHRKKVIGGYYSYEYITEIKPPVEICRGVTDSNGMLYCSKKVEKGGDYIIEAIAGDEKRGFAITNHLNYVYKSNFSEWFGYFSDSDRVDIFPDKKDYKVGEDIKLRVVSPFEKCTALITVEQRGIKNYFVKEFNSKNPIITIKANEDYAPNVVISVVLIRGRIASPPPTFMVDLAKPSIKMGLTEVNVDKKKYRLDVEIETDKNKYLVREKVYGKVIVRGADSDANVMLIVVDEGLLSLMENPTYNILDGIVKKVPYEVRSSSGLIQVVGKRHFGKKAMPSGGGGGRLVTREMFDTLIYFNPSIKTRNGVAEFIFDLNDSITSFRIVAVVTSSSNKFGTGYKNIESTKELFINSSLPYLAREGDRYDAAFVIKNVSDKEFNLNLKGNVIFFNNNKELRKEKIDIKDIKISKGGNKKVSFPVQIVENSDLAKFNIEVSDGKKVIDSISVSQKIIEAVPMRVVQSSFMRFKKSYKINDVFENKNNIRRRINLSFMSNLSGVSEVLKKYKGYTLACLEQKISYAIVSNDLEYFNKLMNEINLYVDDNNLLKYYPSSKDGSPFLTAYILEITSLNGFELPSYIKSNAVLALKNFIMGKIGSKYSYFSGTRNIERLYALSAISPAIPDAEALLNALNLNISELPLSSLVDIGSISPKRKDVYNAIFSSFFEKGGAYFIKSDERNNLWWLMRSEDEAFAKSLIYFIKHGADDTMIGKMVKGLLNRFERGYLYNTTANAYAAVAMRLFEKRYNNKVEQSNLLVSYNCHQYKSDIKADFVEQTFSFMINKENSIFGGEPQPDCLLDNNNLIFEDKKNDYWVRMLFEEESIPDKPVFKGFKLRRELLDEKGQKKNEFKEGDIVKIRLIVEADSYYNNIAIIDPLITGSQVVGRISNQSSDYYWDYTYSDVRDGFMRVYYEYPYSKEILYEYSVRLNTKGYFNLPPTRVELMYMPDIYAELPNSSLEVK